MIKNRAKHINNMAEKDNFVRGGKLGFLFELTSKDVLDEERNEESEEAVEQITKINDIEFAIIVFPALTL